MARKVEPIVGEAVAISTTTPLRQIVKEALLSIMTDPAASAAAKASAGRTLLDYFDDNDTAHGSGKRSSEMTLAELDAELAQR